MNLAINKEQKILQDHIIAFCKKELNTTITERESKSHFPKDLWIKCAEQKLTGLCIDKKYGGAGLDSISSILALEAFGYGCEDNGLSFSVAAHFLSVVIPIFQYGSQEQKETVLIDLCSGKKIGANAISEIESGSDVFSMKTEASFSENEFTVNGSKTYISNGSVADLVLTYVSTDREKGFYGGITPLLIPTETTGLVVTKDFEKMGLKTCKMSGLEFKQVKVPASGVLHKIGSGSIIFNKSMEWERIGMSALQIGITNRILEKAIAFTQTRLIKSEPLSKKQSIAHKLSNIKVNLEAGRLLTYKAALGINNDTNNYVSASTAKLFVSEAFTNASKDILQIFGASGYIQELEIERVYRDAIASTIYSGTSDIQRNIISGYLGL
jgi:alkylation response protein AidB-like acyl-CoA dehydrogenase